MPVDTTKAPSKRKEKNLSPEELKDIEQKRLRGELSCAECRRLKLRCDKKVPCGSCVRRGCESICPCGILEAGAGTRFILASTTQLHSKISTMSTRIRALEDALAIFQSTVSSERHPLLEDELLKIKFGSEVLPEAGIGGGATPGGSSDSSQGLGGGGPLEEDHAELPTLDALGTLTLGEGGETRYFGRSAGSETLILAGERYLTSDDISDTETISEEDELTNIAEGLVASPDSSTAQRSSPSWSEPSPGISSVLQGTQSRTLPPNATGKPTRFDALPDEIYALSIGSVNSPTSLTVTHLLRYLPPLARAQVLAQSYIDHASLFFRPIKKDELFNTVLPLVYSAQIGSSSPHSSRTSWSPRGEGVAHDPSSGSTGDTKPLPIPGLDWTSAVPPQASAGVSPHLLAAVFFIFALGAFLDLSLPATDYGAEGETWFELGRKALSCSRGEILSRQGQGQSDSSMDMKQEGENANEKKPFSTTSSFSSDSEAIDTPYTDSAAATAQTTFAAPPSSAEDTIRALGLMATYCSMAGRYSRDSAWSGMSLTAKIAQGAGFHRDPARWHMDPTTVQRRRLLWWEVFTADISHSLAVGRPPSIHLSFVDCEFPTDEEATLSDDGEEVMGFWRMKYTFARDSFLPVINTTLIAKAPSYAAILDLDRKVREQAPLSGFKRYVGLEQDGKDVYYNSGLSLRDFYASQHRTVTMLYLHRSFFAHAMLKNPSNPLMSPFAPSFLAAYRAASVIIKAAIHFFDRCADIAGRVWFLTYHVFSAAMTVGTVVRRSPNSSIAESALYDLSRAVDLFERCAPISHRNKIAFLLLRKLKEKAVRSYTEFKASKSSSDSVSPPHSETLDTNLFTQPQVGDDEDSELAIFGGQTRVLTKVTKPKVKGKSRKVSQGTVSSPSSSVPGDSPSPHSAESVARPSGSVSADNDQFNADMNIDSMMLDVNMIPAGNFDASIDFGAGTVGTGLGELANMALEGIGVGADVNRSQSTDTALMTQVPPSLMEYLSGTETNVAGTSQPSSNAAALWSSGQGFSQSQVLPPFNIGPSPSQDLAGDWANLGANLTPLVPPVSSNTLLSRAADLQNRFEALIAESRSLNASSSLLRNLRQREFDHTSLSAMPNVGVGAASLPWPVHPPQHTSTVLDQQSSWGQNTPMKYTPSFEQSLTRDYGALLESLGLDAASPSVQAAWNSSGTLNRPEMGTNPDMRLDAGWAMFLRNLGATDTSGTSAGT